jgi:cytochrome c peroxidase
MASERSLTLAALALLLASALLAPAARADGCATLLAQGAGTAADTRCVEQAYRAPRAQWPAPTVDAGVTWQELGPRPPLPAQPPALVALGERLFHDRRLSRAQDISCASCHAPHLGFSDGRRFAAGHDGSLGTRNSPGLWGIGLVPQLMWDGRADSLEAQALLPIVNPIEMAMDLPALLKRLNTETDYPKQFAQALGGHGQTLDVTLTRLSAALASFQRTLQAPRTRFDDFIEGRTQALSAQELRGLHLFRTKARCMNCHSGPQLTQHEFHQIGISLLGRPAQDLGRQAITRRAEDAGAMRTPSLRGVARTAPYMHNGIVPQLRGVLDLYNAGLPQPRNRPDIPPPSPRIKPLKLTADEVQAVEAFLRTL